MKKFRYLRDDEIDVRVGMLSEKGCSLLLYKDARCDMNILDETVGPENWQRSHLRDNANCIVSIYDKEKQVWVSKEDVGTKSNSEPEKGLASDSFKRACTNWGIGRELYTSPFIWLSTDKFELKTVNGKYTTKDKFKVKEIKVTDGVITELVIINAGQYGDKDNIVFIYPRERKINISEQELNDILDIHDDKPKPKILDKAAVATLQDKLKQRNFACRKSATEANFAGIFNKSSFEELSREEFKQIEKKLDKEISKAKAKKNEADRQDS